MDLFPKSAVRVQNVRPITTETSGVTLSIEGSCPQGKSEEGRCGSGIFAGASADDVKRLSLPRMSLDVFLRCDCVGVYCMWPDVCVCAVMLRIHIHVP